MKTVNSTQKTKIFQPSLRPSQSLHTRLAKQQHHPYNTAKSHIESLTVCLLYGKNKIQFNVKPRTSFHELEKALYSHLYSHFYR